MSTIPDLTDVVVYVAAMEHSCASGMPDRKFWPGSEDAGNSVAFADQTFWQRVHGNPIRSCVILTKQDIKVMPPLKARKIRKAGIDPTDVDALRRLTESARRNELVAVMGTGVSVSLTNGKIPALSWKGLIHSGFAYGIKKGKITAKQATAWGALLDSTDIDDLLGAAEFMGRKLDAPRGDIYARWLENVFEPVNPENKDMEAAINALDSAAVPLCTLNYDTLLERVTGHPTISLAETGKVTAWMRREESAILHLHGSWNVPASCVLGIRDYEGTVGDEVRNLIQRTLGTFKRLLFVGCGDTFADPNFSALTRWLRGNMSTAAPEHYALVTTREAAARSGDPAWLGFVEPLAYGATFDELPAFLTRQFQTLSRKTPGRQIRRPKAPSTAVEHARLLQEYRSFLLKDCGQMTIEGMRADMDTAQRRFDLERLFVPLEVLQTPPDIPENDPFREQKLIEWREKHKEPLPFGEVFAGNRRLALLALPGGGKTLLLKRLAVAYADPARRTASSDGLPDLDLTPVLIRCREWREHIHRPILTILKDIPDITGQPSLAGLGDALLPLFKNGRALLLVDGLDEIHSDALRATFVENLERFLEAHKLVRLIVTSREAGFSLVAPTFARFCERWRLAQLNAQAITSLCVHWHSVMMGDSLEARAEGGQVAESLVRNESLRRLAENPLLLTMLLVVKRGAGRLPPDRVSLYGRAVEVLLDTWNIKGHDPLNPKEAVPQLAYVAFQLMRAGRQTATEKELLNLLDEARENVPQIRRYAKDTPQEFLKRVELRSSLLVEAGRQTDGSGTAPFYQFRHLTFQEYLAAVAAVEGHYIGYDRNDTVLAPLKSYFLAEEWKEVIPMSAVLARKQAEPLMRALLEQGSSARQQFETGNWEEAPRGQLPPPIARMLQCLVEEAEASPETLTSALQLIALCARGCSPEHDYRALSRGPYGKELLHQAWLLYAPMAWRPETGLRNTCAQIAFFQERDEYWQSAEGQEELSRLLRSEKTEEVGRGLMTCSGALFNTDHEQRPTRACRLPMSEVESHIFHDDAACSNAATWAWALARGAESREVPASPLLDRLLSLWLSGGQELKNMAAFALSRLLGLPRGAWTPTLSTAGAGQVRQAWTKPVGPPDELGDFLRAATCAVAFHSRTVWPDADLAANLTELSESRTKHAPDRKRAWDPIAETIKQLGQRRRIRGESRENSRSRTVKSDDRCNDTD